MKFLYIFFLYFSLASCVSTTISTTNVQLVKTKLTKKQYVDGNTLLTSHKKNSKVSLIIPDSELKDGGRLHLILLIHNSSEDSQNFNPKKIKVVRKSKKDLLHVFSYSELAKEVKKARNSYARWSAAGLALSSIDAGKSNYSGSIKSNSSADYSYSGQHYNSYLAKLEMDRNASNIKRNLASYDNKARNLKNIILKKNTILPKEFISGTVVVKIPGMKKEKDYFKIIVPFARDNHSFYIKQNVPI